MGTVELLNGDCLDVLKWIEDNSVDALITDPPAGISFMGKDWDGDKGGRKQWIEWMTSVMTECLRVMKPGAHGLVWALPRTSHWTATALEDAGFEVRDIVTHLFGSGFPKSLDVSKAMDKSVGAEREVIRRHIQSKQTRKLASSLEGSKDGSLAWQYDVTAPASDLAKQWSGWGTALKPASEHWILIRKPLSENTVAKNVEKWGCGAINIDANRIEASSDDPNVRGNRGFGHSSGGYKSSYVGGDADKQIKEYHQHSGRFPANLVFSHSDHCTDTQCDIECAIKMLDEQSGKLHGAGTYRHGNGALFGGANGESAEKQRPALDSGGFASRFFYCAKASKRDKGTSNSHPTVKSTKLMEYLIRMITPPKGIVLDPFMGSGSTGVAAKRLGFDFIGIERDAEYTDIAEKRIR